MCPLISTCSATGFAIKPYVKWTKSWIISLILICSLSLCLFGFRLHHWISAACLWLICRETRRFEDCRKKEKKGKRVRLEGIERDLKIRMKKGRAHTHFRMPPMVCITRLSPDTDANNFRHSHLENEWLGTNASFRIHSVLRYISLYHEEAEDTF